MLIPDSDNNPYGMIQEEGPLKDVPSSVIHRYASSSSEYIRIKPIKEYDNGNTRRVSKLEPGPTESGSVVYIKQHNKNLIEGLVIPSSEESSASSTARSPETINLEDIKRRIQDRKSTHQRTTLNPVPKRLQETEDNDRPVENIIPISDSDIKQSHESTEELSKRMASLNAKHLGLLLSFDNASSYIEAFAKDGLEMQNEISVDDSPFHFLRHLCSIDAINKYVRELDLEEKYKEEYMSKAIDYFVKLASRESDASIKAELFRRTNNMQKAKANISSEESHDSYNRGAMVKRNR